MASLSIEERLRWYDRILSLSQKASEESLEATCRYLMDDIIEAGGAECGYFFLIDRSGEPQIVYARTDSREDIPTASQVYSSSIVKRALEMAVPLIIGDASVHPEFREAKSVIAANLKSVLALPIYFNKKAIGVIYLENRNQAQFFAPELMEVLTLFCTQAGVLLHSKLKEGGSFVKGARSQESALSSNNAKLQKVFKEIEIAAKAESSVLLLGETGTGKEVTARKIHALSNRSQMPFVPINCAAIPDTLLESELFGYKKGAFTGANADREGLIRRAHKGVLFLDEIGDVPLQMQVKLLRVIQERRFTRVGSTQEEESDFRLICATHRPLEQAIEQGFFRQDLFFRINTLTIQLPPLRERPEDILDLAHDFLEQACRENSRRIKGFDEDAKALLLREEWPGNIRQLQNAIQRAVALVPQERLNSTLNAADFHFLAKKAAGEPALPSLADAKEEFVRDYVKKAILIHKGNKTKAAKALGVDPKTLYRHLNPAKAEGED
jgi:transcriptional regulator with PAS, ATPase and Fis domain